MNAITQTSRSGRRRRGDTASLGAIGLLLVITHPGELLAADQTGYPENGLSNPGKAVMLAEKRGRVTIYAGSQQRVIDRARDSQFDRESLPDDNVASDDDCD